MKSSQEISTLKNLSEEELHNQSFLIYFFSKEQHPTEYQFIPKSNFDNSYFLHFVLLNNPDIYLMLDSKQKNIDLYKRATQKHKHRLLEFASKKQLEDEKFCINAIKEDTRNYNFLPELMQKDWKIIELAHKSLLGWPQHEFFYKSIHKDLINDIGFCNFLVKLSFGKCYKFLPKKIREDLNLAEIATSLNPKNFEFIDPKIQNDTTFIKKILPTIYDSDIFRDFINLVNSDIVDKDIANIIANKMPSFFNKLSLGLRSNINVLKSYIEGPKASTTSLQILLDNMLPLDRRQNFKRIVGKNYGNKGNEESIRIFKEACAILNYESLKKQIPEINEKTNDLKLKI